MQVEAALDFPRVLRGLDELLVRYVVIGGQAVLLHGIPLFSFDFDLWIEPGARSRVLDWLERGLGLDVAKADDDGARPIVRAFAGMERLDLFFVRAMTNRDGVTLVFDDVYERAVDCADEGAGLAHVPVASVDDLILLKRMAPAPRAKDEEAIRALLAKKHLELSGGR